MTTEWTLTLDQQPADAELRAACPALDWHVTFASPDGQDVRWEANNAFAAWSSYEVYERWCIGIATTLYPSINEVGRGMSARAAADMIVTNMHSQIRHRQACVDALSPSPTTQKPAP